jgi:leucyl aminopeptidase (aminopeptidase T)
VQSDHGSCEKARKDELQVAKIAASQDTNKDEMQVAKIAASQDTNKDELQVAKISTSQDTNKDELQVAKIAAFQDTNKDELQVAKIASSDIAAFQQSTMPLDTSTERINNTASESTEYFYPSNQSFNEDIGEEFQMMDQEQENEDDIYLKQCE